MPPVFFSNPSLAAFKAALSASREVEKAREEDFRAVASERREVVKAAWVEEADSSRGAIVGSVVVVVVLGWGKREERTVVVLVVEEAGPRRLRRVEVGEEGRFLLSRVGAEGEGGRSKYSVRISSSSEAGDREVSSS